MGRYHSTVAWQHRAVTTPSLFNELVERGLVHDSTDPTALGERLEASPISVYVGFDPTADSLHVGHLLGQLTLRRFQLAGHKPYPLAGGATGMVGDPSGRSEERNLLDRDTLQHNVDCITAQLERLLDFSSGPSQAVLVNNADWTAPITALDFLRDVGKHITINQMLAKESVRNRLNSENGLSFTEFSYMLLQANDFRHLCAEHNVELQLGGSDQWGNITAGIDLIRKTLSRSAFGATWPLVTRSDGQKFGKTADGAVWLDPMRTSPYKFRQFWIQISDDEAATYLPRFSLRSLEEIHGELSEHVQAPEKRIAQRARATEMTTLVHGGDAAHAVEAAASVLFGDDPKKSSRDAFDVVVAEVPRTDVAPSELSDVIAVLSKTGLCSSNSDARRTLTQKGIRANGDIVEGESLADLDLLHGRYVLLRKGKSNYHILDVHG
jgi:tyrosyl-tRNA synthetase